MKILQDSFRYLNLTTNKFFYFNKCGFVYRENSSNTSSNDLSLGFNKININTQLDLTKPCIGRTKGN